MNVQFIQEWNQLREVTISGVWMEDYMIDDGHVHKNYCQLFLTNIFDCEIFLWYVVEFDVNLIGDFFKSTFYKCYSSFASIYFMLSYWYKQILFIWKLYTGMMYVFEQLIRRLWETFRKSCAPWAQSWHAI